MAPSPSSGRKRGALVFAVALLLAGLVGGAWRAAPLDAQDAKRQAGRALAEKDESGEENGDEGGDARDDDAGPRALLGELVSGRDGAPVVGAEVRAVLANRAVATAVSADDGTFALEGLSAPISALRFRAPGFHEVELDGASLPGVREAFWSQTLEPSGDVEARATTGLAITVVDARGRPVPAYRLTTWSHGAPAQAQGGARGPQRRARMPPVTVDVSAADGRFVAALAPGTFSVSVAAEGFRPPEPVTATVEEGALRDVRVALSASIAVRGTVRDAATGAPVAGAEVRISGAGGIAPVFSSADGSFALRSVLDEDLSIHVEAPGYIDVDIGGIDGARSRDEVLDVTLTPARAGVAAEVVGIGIGVAPHPDGIRVSNVFSTGPAAGLVEADEIIVEVDGQPVIGRRMRESVASIRGPEGTRVSLSVRGLDGAVRRVDIVRARVAVPEG